MPSSSPPLPWYRQLYFQVIVAVILGVLAGVFLPEQAARLKPLGDGFIRMVKMMVAPIVFCTIVHGIASVGDLKKLGRVGIKALVYFEIVSTLALIIGLVVVNWMQPGTGITPPGEVFHVDDSAKAASLGFAEKAKPHSFVDFILNIIPTSLFGPFVSGELLQVLFVSLLLAFAISMGEKGKFAPK
ncbi:MAG: cation:dicarboxylase symporter family transporter [Pirellulales bacterium]